MRNTSRRGCRDASLLFTGYPPQPLPILFLSPQKSYLLHDAWKHAVFSYNFLWPLTSSAQMQYDPAATIHFGLWSGFNEFLLCVRLSALLLWSLPLSLGNAALSHIVPLEVNIFPFSFLWIWTLATRICTDWGIYLCTCLQKFKWLLRANIQEYILAKGRWIFKSCSLKMLAVSFSDGFLKAYMCSPRFGPTVRICCF